jgi:hypothetical protein
LQLANLLWVYKEPELCVERARRLRRLNPTLKLYVLYGGDLAEADRFRQALDPYYDDFYAFSEDWPSERKWLHGDQMIAAWHRDRGMVLPWDTIFVAQWDILMLEPLDTLCAGLQPDELILPGLRSIRDVESWWWWTRSDSVEAREYRAFAEALGAAFPEDPLCCNFLAAALPRAFLDRYAALENPDLGFLEYKIPVYAQAWGLGFCRDHPFNPVWRHEMRRDPVSRYFDTLHAEKAPIPTPVVQLNALLPRGRRVFHPYVKPFSGPEPWARKAR